MKIKGINLTAAVMILFTVILLGKPVEATWTPVAIIEVKSNGQHTQQHSLTGNTTWKYIAPPGLRITGWSGSISSNDPNNLKYNVSVNDVNERITVGQGPNWFFRNNLNAQSIEFKGEQSGTNSSYLLNGFVVLSADLPTGSITASISDSDKTDIASKVAQNSTITTMSSNVLDAKNTLRTGADNNGKSLAATYDKAIYGQYAYNDIQYGSYNGGKSLAAAYDKANEAKAAAEQPNVFKVVKGIAFTEIMYGQISGSSGGVTATPISGKNASTITGTLNTVGVSTITIGGKDLLFKVVDAPTTSYSASVSLSE